MKTFSKYLSDYVADCQISWQKTAQLCGMDRTLLSRYASGKRLPENINKVKKIAKGLSMTEQQTEEFKILYQISKGGEPIYKALNLISQIFYGQNVAPFSMPVRRQSQYIWQETQAQRLHGAEEICDAAAWLVNKSSLLRIQMGTIEKDSYLFPILAAANCRIEHILQIDCGNQRKTVVEEFERLIPFLNRGKEYQIYCYYQFFRKEAESVAGMHFMLGNQGLLLFSDDFARGIFTSRAEYRKYYEKMYLDKIKKSRIFGASGCSLSKIEKSSSDGYFLENPSSGIVFAYQSTPCERIWVKTERDVPGGFYLEEVELVKLFKKYIDYAAKWGYGVKDKQEK